MEGGKRKGSERGGGGGGREGKKIRGDKVN